MVGRQNTNYCENIVLFLRYPFLTTIVHYFEYYHLKWLTTYKNSFAPQFFHTSRGIRRIKKKKNPPSHKWLLQRQDLSCVMYATKNAQMIHAEEQREDTYSDKTTDQHKLLGKKAYWPKPMEDRWLWQMSASQCTSYGVFWCNNQQTAIHVSEPDFVFLYTLLSKLGFFLWKM